MLRYSLVVILMGLWAGPVGLWAQDPRAFGNEGELFHVKAGTYAELFAKEAGAGELPPATPVLALEVVAAEGSVKRWLVPGSEGPSVDRLSATVYERESGRLFLLWDSKIAPTLSRLNLVGFGDGAWTEVVEISGDPLPLKGDPRLAVTRDSYDVTGFGQEGLADPLTRTVLHVVWWEESPGVDQVYYAPVIFLNGEFLGWNPVVALNDYDTSAPLDVPSEGTPLFELPVVDSGTDFRSVVVAMANPATGRFLTLEVRVLPAVLSILANSTVQEILEIGNDLEDGSIQSLAGAAKGHIVGMGARLHAGVRSYLAERAALQIQLFGERFTRDDLPVIAKEVRGVLVDEGASFLGREFRGFDYGGGCGSLHLALDPSLDEQYLHELEICVVSDRPLPEVGGAATTVIVSEAGEEALVAWVEGDALLYRQSTAAGWSQVRTAHRNPGVNLSQAQTILRRLLRVR